MPPTATANTNSTTERQMSDPKKSSSADVPTKHTQQNLGSTLPQDQPNAAFSTEVLIGSRISSDYST